MLLNDLFSIKGKVAVVTGGSRGIGQMIASGFCANGAKVYVTARSKNTVLETAKIISDKYDSECIGIKSDISTLDGVKELAKIIYHKITQKMSKKQTKHTIKNHNN